MDNKDELTKTSHELPGVQFFGNSWPIHETLVFSEKQIYHRFLLLLFRFASI